MKRGIHMCPRCFFVSNRQRQSTICFFIARWLDNCGTYLPFRFRGTNWTMPQRTSQAIESWNNEGSGSTDQSRWRVVPAVIWWTIWKERNMRCFESVSSPLHMIKMNCTILFAIGAVWSMQMILQLLEISQVLCMMKQDLVQFCFKYMQLYVVP